jgi:hypothetical protein
MGIPGFNVEVSSFESFNTNQGGSVRAEIPKTRIVPALHWGDFKSSGCSATGFRQYSAVLWDIPFGQSWEQACANMPADVAGLHFEKPTRCRNDHGLNMWGEFDVPDAGCPIPTPINKDVCHAECVAAFGLCSLTAGVATGGLGVAGCGIIAAVCHARCFAL